MGTISPASRGGSGSAGADVIGFGREAAKAAFRFTAVGTNAADSFRKSRSTGAAEMVVGGADGVAVVVDDDEDEVVVVRLPELDASGVRLGLAGNPADAGGGRRAI